MVDLQFFGQILGWELFFREFVSPDYFKFLSKKKLKWLVWSWERDLYGSGILCGYGGYFWVGTYAFGRVAPYFRYFDLLWRCRLLGLDQWFISSIYLVRSAYKFFHMRAKEVRRIWFKLKKYEYIREKNKKSNAICQEGFCPELIPMTHSTNTIVSWPEKGGAWM